MLAHTACLESFPNVHACRRKVYDETGIYGDDVLGGAKFEDLKEYFQGLYKRVTEDDIVDFTVGRS